MLMLVLIACITYMSIHMKSLFLAFFSIINLFFGIPISLCIYRYVAGVTYFSVIHIAVIILIVGIGADDVFVFHDFWIGSHKIEYIKDDI